MASLTDSLTTQGRPDGVYMTRVGGEGRHEALSLLLTGSLRGGRGSVDQFLGYATQQSLNLQDLWAAYEGGPGGRPIAATLVIPAAGRTAMVFISPVGRSRSPRLLAELVRLALSSQDAQRTHLAQCLLEPGQSAEAQVLVDAGFRRLAHLVYMQRAVPGQALPDDLGDGFEVVNWHPSHRKLFSDAVLASYEQTCDCPGLLGLRDIDDIIDGHKATGEFDPLLWITLRHHGEPVAVMLLNPVMQRRAMELVYLGISRAWRGRGIGRRLLHRALNLSREQRVKSIVLAVDELNHPAMHLYRSMNFVTGARKLAMIFALPQAQPASR